MHALVHAAHARQHVRHHGTAVATGPPFPLLQLPAGLISNHVVPQLGPAARRNLRATCHELCKLVDGAPRTGRAHSLVLQLVPVYPENKQCGVLAHCAPALYDALYGKHQRPWTSWAVGFEVEGLSEVCRIIRRRATASQHWTLSKELQHHTCAARQTLENHRSGFGLCPATLPQRLQRLAQGSGAAHGSSNHWCPAGTGISHRRNLTGIPLSVDIHVHAQHAECDLQLVAPAAASQAGM